MDADGTVYVADSANNRVDVFASEGAFIRAFGKAVNPAGGDICTTATGCKVGTGTSLAGGLRSPTGVAIGPDGALYIADSENHRVSVFSSDGTFIRAFGKGTNPGGGNVCTAGSGCWPGAEDGSAGSLAGPYGLASPTGLGIDPAGTVYVAGTTGRIDVYTSDGTFLRAFGRGVSPAGGSVCTAATGCMVGTEGGVAGGIGNAWDVAVSDDRLVAVSDGNERRVSIFESDGTFIRAFGEGVSLSAASTVVGTCTAMTGCRTGTVSSAAGGFAYTLGIDVTGDGNLLAADYSNHRIAEFNFDGAFIRAFGEGVLNGGPNFQTCTLVSGCRQGLNNANIVSLGWPMGIATDCKGAIYASLSSSTASPTLIKRLGELDTEGPPCPPSDDPPNTDAGSAGASRSQASSSPATALPTPRFAKPKIAIELNKGSGTAALVATISNPGMLILKGKGIRKVKRWAKHAGLVEIPITPRKKVKRRLKRRGKAKVRIVLVFRVPNFGSSVQARKVKLKMARGF